MDIKDWLGQDNQLGIDIWTKKYQYNDETFDQWLDRVSGGDQDVRQLIIDKKFLFGGRILANRDISGNKTYSNCYVLTPPNDNIESIFTAASKLARTFSYGGGVGIDIGKLAPRGARVNNTAKETSGAVSFMDLYNLTTGLIGQNGRRGALMLSIPVNHPDVEEFVDIKTDLNKITNANISIRVDDKFMEAVMEDADYELTFHRPESKQTITKTIRAKELFRKICEANWNYAEPGILFWDAIESQNLLSEDSSFHYAGTNPCAEEPLPAGGSCLLGALNLAAFVKEPFTEQAEFDYEEFKHAIDIAVKALNIVLDEGLPLHPLQEQQDSVYDWRQIGLGIMGLADMLIQLGLTYGSNEANKVCGQVGKTLFAAAVRSSEQLSKVVGNYPQFNKAAVNASAMLQEAGIQVEGLANSQLLTIAPTGTISTMIGVSGGIEPIFANSYTRMTKSLHGEDKVYKVYTPIVEAYMKEHDITREEDLPKFFITSKDITPFDRVKCQGIWQQYIDASISSTINLPNSATVEDIEGIYRAAWQCGLKGVTVYRAGCAREGILVEEPKKQEIKKPRETQKTYGIERHLTTGCGSLHVCAFFNEDGELINTYLSKGSTGGCNNYMIGLSRMIGLAARSGAPIEAIIDQLDSCGACPSYAVRTATKHDTSPGSCCPVAVGRALAEMYTEVTGKKFIPAKQQKKNVCEKCGNELIQEGGCVICKNCGWSKCD